MGDPEYVLGSGGGGSEGVDDDTLLIKEDAEVAKLHIVEEPAVDGEDEDDGLGTSLVRGSTGLYTLLGFGSSARESSCT